MHYIIERRGGLAGLRASCTLDADALAAGDRQALERLLDTDEPVAPSAGADQYTFVVTRHGPSGTMTREIPEAVMPTAVARAVTTDI